MYSPENFGITEFEEIVEIIKNYGFASLISLGEEGPICTHVPLIYEPETGCLLGHIAKNNPHCGHLQKSNKVLVIFNGPHAYISPDWYVGKNNVPTWNYVAVHVRGELEFFTDAQDINRVLLQMSLESESANGTDWDYQVLSDSLKKGLFSAIKAFRISMDSVYGKAKMSQNRNPEDIDGVIQGLEQVGNKEAAKIVAKFRESSERNC